MTEKIENLILEHLRAIRTDVTNIAKKLSENTLRLGGLESGIASIKTDVANHYNDIALISSRADGLLERIERIEKRLEIIPG